MSDQAEVAFLRTYLNTLGSQPVTYADDYQQPPANSLRRIPVLQIPVPAPPPRTSIASSSATLTLTIKSLRPPAQYSLAVHPTDSIAQIKEQLVHAYPAAPPADTQRLLLKGKALADNKLVREYSVKDGDTLNLLVKPSTTTPATTTTSEMASDDSQPSLSIDLKGSPSLSPSANVPSRGHQRIPSVVLSPSPSAEAPPGDIPSSSGSSSPSTRSRQNSTTRDITLTLDNATPALAEQELSTYHAGIANPQFWQGLLAYLGTSLPPADAQLAFEEFLRAAKGTLTASEIARIRDQVGVTGMGGF
ncbi:ubiquitin-domain-containing protein [Mycena rebaudengoi]|nr:ubiquitin-domain-containing protein [Mycena rebaudengoi]